MVNVILINFFYIFVDFLCVCVSQQKSLSTSLCTSDELISTVYGVAPNLTVGILQFEQNGRNVACKDISTF